MVDQLNLLPIWDTITTAWDKVKGSKASFWGAVGFMFLALFCLGFVAGIFQNTVPLLSSLINLIAQLINFLLQMSILYMGILRARNMPIQASMVFRALNTPKLAMNLVGLYILQLLIFLPMIVVLILTATVLAPTMANGGPGAIALGALCVLATLACIYVSVRLVLSMGAIFDKDCNPIEAIKLSFCGTRHNVWRLIGLFFVQIGIFIVAVMPLAIPMIWVMPLGFIVYGTMYNRLLVNANWK
jgi:hypothetical protein